MSHTHTHRDLACERERERQKKLPKRIQIGLFFFFFFDSSRLISFQSNIKWWNCHLDMDQQWFFFVFRFHFVDWIPQFIHEQSIYHSGFDPNSFDIYWYYYWMIFSSLIQFSIDRDDFFFFFDDSFDYLNQIELKSLWERNETKKKFSNDRDRRKKIGPNQNGFFFLIKLLLVFSFFFFWEIIVSKEKWTKIIRNYLIRNNLAIKLNLISFNWLESSRLFFSNLIRNSL